jgi:NAD(P)-dependent dehydrogenase (short-subunit alcohol dehydrogenase family)
MNTKVRKAAIVTGASRGIGKDIALRLAADGFAVAISYAGNQTQAAATVSEIQEKGGTAIAVKGNIADADDVATLFSAGRQAFGRLDAVISNAGVMDLAPIKTDNVAAFDRVMATNVRGTFLQRHRQGAARLRAVRRVQIRRRRTRARPGQRAPRPQHNGERHRARTSRHRVVPQR